MSHQSLTCHKNDNKVTCPLHCSPLFPIQSHPLPQNIYQKNNLSPLSSSIKFLYPTCTSSLCPMSKRRNPTYTTGVPDGYPGLRSKRPKLAPLPHERDYLSLPTAHPLSLPLPPVKQHHHRYDLRVRPPRPPNPSVNGHRRGNGEKSLHESGCWRNAHSFSLNYQQQRFSNSSVTSSRTRRRHAEPAQDSPNPQRKRRKQAPPNENEPVRFSLC